MTNNNTRTGLTAFLQDEAEQYDMNLADLTVLANQNDPFRVGTEARRRDGEWLAIKLDELMPDRDTIHLRGLHYALIGTTKPDGTPYINTDATWEWLLGHAAKSARWNGYVPFDRIIDAKNAPPKVVPATYRLEPARLIAAGVEIEIPDPEDIEPRPVLAGFKAEQEYRLAIYGEKSSLDPVLDPIAAEYGADLYLPAGEMTDSMIFQLASAASEDVRPLVLFTFSDADPGGWQMPISIGRKLQAFEAIGKLTVPSWRVVRVGLTPAQVKQYGLPSTPLKTTEKRADAWTEATGTMQTEIDSLATLRPEVLDDIAREAIDPFFDSTLARRTRFAAAEWTNRATEALDANLDETTRRQLVDDATQRLAEMAEEVEAINEAMRFESMVDVLPPVPVVPMPTYGPRPDGLVNSEDDFVEQTEALKASKRYEDVEERGE